MEYTLNTPLTRLPGVGEARGKKLAHLGLETVGDLLTWYPRDYEDRRVIYTILGAPMGEKACVRAMAASAPRLSHIRRGLDLVKVQAVDEAGVLDLTFFNQPYMERALHTGEEYIFYGVVEPQGRRRTMVNPVVEPADRRWATGRIMPVYPLTAGISNHLLAGLVQRCLACTQLLPEDLPDPVRRRHALVSAQEAGRAIHFPDTPQQLKAARRRLTFEELFDLSAGLAFLKERRSHIAPGIPIPREGEEEFFTLLPFAPTGAQRRVMAEIAADLSSGRPMNRLVQGDVGSGKTAVAAYAAFLAARAGRQTALMAPTEVLAEQHCRSLAPLLASAGVRVGLLTGSLPAGEKRQMKRAMAAGEVDLVIGTHALISKGVEFHDLALMVADEQHRFGVAQRAALAAKARPDRPPHVLVMSATPIPRTLALMVYGDLDVSIMDELPPGRTPVETYVIHEDKRSRMYAFVRKQTALGRQVYIICPAVEEGEPGEDGSAPMDLKAVTAYARQLREEVFPELSVGLLHGRLRPGEKEAAMSAFARGETQVLVSTTVVEVGVDVPNASLIIVENAERFGLSQLHQLRGRVGRGSHQSYCILMTKSRQEEAMRRLRTLAATTDGFQIAQADLDQRGPGDFFGRRQHGLPQLRLADLTQDMALLRDAQEEARKLLEEDPGLSRPDNACVLERIRALFSDTPDMFN